MARLILINGAPASGKSTLARRYVAGQPLALALDLDVIRGMLGRWDDQPRDAGLATRAMALAMAGVHLTAGHDVVIPQYLGRPEFLLQLEGLARAVGATLVEIVLDTEVDDVIERFRRRSADPVRGEHRDAAELVQRAGGPDELRRSHDRLRKVIAQRPGTIRITTGGTDAALADLLAALATPATGTPPAGGSAGDRDGHSPGGSAGPA